jgi:cardiolipin synthase (CMP-forming)
VTLSWLPNAITLARLFASGPLAWLILDGEHALALVVAALAGVSDAVDGILAKRYGWQTRLGGLLDPIADKLMLFAVFIALSIVDELPWWLTWLAVGRDVVIVAGAVTYHVFVQPLEAAPSRLSKATTLLQIVLALVLLVHGLDNIDVPEVLRVALIWATAALTAASGLHYVLFWGAKARRDARARRTEESK